MSQNAEHYTHFIPEATGDLRTAIDTWRAKADEAATLHKTFAAEFGADHTCSTGHHIAGLIWNDPGKVHAGWKLAKAKMADGNPYWVPDRKTKAGRDAVKRMHALPVARSNLLTQLICGVTLIFTGRDNPRGGMSLGGCSLEIFDGSDVVGIPNVYEGETSRPHTIPKDARRLKLSEYHAMKEDHEFAELKKSRAKRKRAAA